MAEDNSQHNSQIFMDFVESTHYSQIIMAALGDTEHYSEIWMTEASDHYSEIYMYGGRASIIYLTEANVAYEISPASSLKDSVHIHLPVDKAVYIYSDSDIDAADASILGYKLTLNQPETFKIRQKIIAVATETGASIYVWHNYRHI